MKLSAVLFLVLQMTRCHSNDCKGKPADIFFILDSSNSVYKDDFHDKTLSFVRDVVSTFDIGPNKTRVGMVTYSDTVEFNFGLKAHQDKQSLLNAIQPKYVRYIGGLTHTGDAIKFVRMNGYQVGGSARPGAARIIIVITDGISDYPEITKREAQSARNVGYYIFAIGVGKYFNYQELYDIASIPYSDFVFTVDDYSSLNTIHHLISHKACDTISSYTPTLQACIPTHVHFIYESGTKSVAERASVVDVMWRFSNDRSNRGLPIKVGVTTDACTSSKKIPFSDIEKFRKTLKTLQSTQKVTMYSLVKRFNKQIQKQYQDDPRNTVQLMVVFVDENTQNLAKLNRETRYAQAAGFKVMVIAFGKVSEYFLRRMVSKPRDKLLYKVNNYEELTYVNLRVSQLACDNRKIASKRSKTSRTTTLLTTSVRPRTRSAVPYWLRAMDTTTKRPRTRYTTTGSLTIGYATTERQMTPPSTDETPPSTDEPHSTTEERFPYYATRRPS